MAGVAARELLQQLASGPLAGAALQQLTVADLKKLCWSYAYAEVEPGAPHGAWEAHYMGLTKNIRVPEGLERGRLVQFTLLLNPRQPRAICWF